jgi:hypothetical protein
MYSVKNTERDRTMMSSTASIRRKVLEYMYISYNVFHTNHLLPLR